LPLGSSCTEDRHAGQKGQRACFSSSSCMHRYLASLQWRSRSSPPKSVCGAPPR
jgi:hypothetical protein